MVFNFLLEGVIKLPIFLGGIRQYKCVVISSDLPTILHCFGGEYNDHCFCQVAYLRFFLSHQIVYSSTFLFSIHYFLQHVLVILVVSACNTPKSPSPNSQPKLPKLFFVSFPFSAKKRFSFTKVATPGESFVPGRLEYI